MNNLDKVRERYLDKVRERNRVTKQGVNAMITNYLRLEKELYAAQRELVSLKTGIPNKREKNK